VSGSSDQGSRKDVATPTPEPACERGARATIRRRDHMGGRGAQVVQARRAATA
jgi:hypothetical protein